MQHQLQKLLPPNNLKMSPNLRILPRKTLNLVLTQPLPQSRIQLPREIIIKLRQEFDVKEEDRSLGQFGGDDVQEDFRTVVFVRQGGALFGARGEGAEAEDVRAVAEEDCFFAWRGVSFSLEYACLSTGRKRLEAVQCREVKHVTCY